MDRLDFAISRLEELDKIVGPKLDNLADPQLPRNLLDKANYDVNSRGLMGEIIRQRFNTGTSQGRAWAKDKPSTVKDKTKRGEANDLLNRTGALRQAAIKAVENSFNIMQPINFDLSKVGLRYAKVVNKKRPFFATPSTDELRDTIEVVSESLTRGIKDALK